MNTIMSKRDFSFFKKGKCYEYWTNFGGLNHIVKYGTLDDNIYPFDGPTDDPDYKHGDSDRKWIFDYFYTLEEMRDIKIDQIL